MSVFGWLVAGWTFVGSVTLGACLVALIVTALTARGWARGFRRPLFALLLAAEYAAITLWLTPAGLLGLAAGTGFLVGTAWCGWLTWFMAVDSRLAPLPQGSTAASDSTQRPLGSGPRRPSALGA